MNLYEVIFIARPDLTQSQTDALTQLFSGVIKEQGGTISKVEYCGLKNFAYKIRKHKKGHYTLLNVTASGDVISEMERHMRLNEDVLRHLSIRVEEHDPAPSALSQTRATRDTRRHHDHDDSDFMGDLSHGTEEPISKGDRK
jgi:small subunit ribosomal protein S6